MDYKNISEQTLEASKNIPAPSKPKMLNKFNMIGIPAAVLGTFGVVYVYLFFLGMSQGIIDADNPFLMLPVAFVYCVPLAIIMLVILQKSEKRL